MKRLVSFLVSFALFVSVIFCFSLEAFASQTQIGDSDTYYSYNSSTKTITISGTGDMPIFFTSDRAIPWYDYLDDVENIVIEEGVTNVGNYSFYNSNAVSVSIASTVKRIGDCAFGNMFLLKSLSIPYGVRYINQDAFFSCKRLVDLTLPDSLVVIGARAFKSCSSLTNVVIPYSVTNIGMYAFNRCTNLENVSFQSMSAKVTISDYAFLTCEKLKTLNVPKNAICNKYFYGYQTNSTKYSDVTLNVFNTSNAFNYAIINGFEYNLLDVVDTECGVPYYNYYYPNMLDEVHNYTFVADSDSEYCFYTTGQIDVRAKLYLDGKLVASNEDISEENRNICIKYNCKKGEIYDLQISSVYYQGEYNLMILPTQISSISVSGVYSINASSGKMDDDNLLFSFDNSILNDNLFVVEYSNGFLHRFVYKDSYYNGTNITVDTNVNMACGENDLAVHIGQASGSKKIYVDHSYTTSNVAPTPDEDGYTLNQCINCDSSYKTDYYKTDKTIYTLSGKCVLGENKYGYHSLDLPYYCPTIIVNGRKYNINQDGSWTIRTFDSCYIVFNNPYGTNATLHYVVDKDNVDQDYGVIALDGYDFNADGYVNAIDYVIYRRELKDSLCDGYWQFVENFITTHK